MGDINTTLTDVGGGLGALFDGIAIPLGTLLIVVGIAGAVVGMLYAIAKVIGRT